MKKRKSFLQKAETYSRFFFGIIFAIMLIVSVSKGNWNSFDGSQAFERGLGGFASIVFLGFIYGLYRLIRFFISSMRSTKENQDVKEGAKIDE